MEVSHSFLSTLRQLAAQVRSTDPALNRLAYFNTPTDHELVELRHSTVGMLIEAEKDAKQLLDEVLPALEGTPLEDLAAMVASEIGRDLHQIEWTQSDDSTIWQIGMLAVQLLSKVLKAVTAIENAYCREAGIESEISYVAEVKTAVEIRQAYAKMWQSIDRISLKTDVQLEDRLRSTSNVLAYLSGRPIFLDMRTLDRQLLLRLLRRIRDWLTQPADPQAGERLWDDVVGFVNLVRLINQRAELVEHDRMIVPRLRRALDALEGESTTLTEHAQVHEMAKKLFGLHPDLDRLLSDAANTSIDDLRTVVGQMKLPGDSPAAIGEPV